MRDLYKRVIELFESEHVGKENSISMRNLAEKLKVSERNVRYIFEGFRKGEYPYDRTFISCKRGYYLATKEEETKIILKKAYNHFRNGWMYLNYAKEKLQNGQALFNLTTQQVEILQTISEVRI